MSLFHFVTSLLNQVLAKELDAYIAGLTLKPAAKALLDTVVHQVSTHWDREVCVWPVVDASTSSIGSRVKPSACMLPLTVLQKKFASATAPFVPGSSS